MSQHVLITGPPGSGKTYLSAIFRRQGLNAVDADEIPDLHGWFDRAGRQIRFPEDGGAAFFATHRFLWHRPTLERYLEKQAKVILFGSADNVFDMVDLFDTACFLKVAPDVLVARLNHPSRRNPMGKTEAQLQHIRAAARTGEAQAHKVGALILDGEAAPGEIIRVLASAKRVVGP